MEQIFTIDIIRRNFYKIKSGKVTGYVSKQYLATGKRAEGRSGCHRQFPFPTLHRGLCLRQAAQHIATAEVLGP